jgi:hypothetical protein
MLPISLLIRRDAGALRSTHFAGEVLAKANSEGRLGGRQPGSDGTLGHAEGDSNLAVRITV